MKKLFYPMSQKPERSKDVNHWSQAVLVFEKEDEYSDFGYFDFNEDQWHVLGNISMPLFCWCYIPNPKKYLENNNFKPVKHFGYRD